VPPDDYFVPSDLDALRRENELLSLENTYLKGRIAGLELELERAGKSTPPAPAAPREGDADDLSAEP
jgi:hypothetical protein